MKLKPVTNDGGDLLGWSFYCQGCDSGHVFWTSRLVWRNGDPWTFNGNAESPTFEPSLLNTCEHDPDPKQRCCHLNLTAGKLHFHADCTHDLKGQTVDLDDHWPDVPAVSP